VVSVKQLPPAARQCAERLDWDADTVIVHLITFIREHVADPNRRLADFFNQIAADEDATKVFSRYGKDELDRLVQESCERRALELNSKGTFDQMRFLLRNGFSAPDLS
jgi:hypothetical protein